MSYRELSMIDVKEFLRRWAAGQSNRKIARDTGTDRGTVARYVAVAEQLALPRDREPTEDEVHEVAQRVQARPLPDASAEWQSVAIHKARIEEWLSKKRPLRLSKVHTLRRYVMEELGWRKKAPTIRIDDPPPGQEAQIDFGKMGPMLDPASGRVRPLWALIVTLSFSRYQWVHGELRRAGVTLQLLWAEYQESAGQRGDGARPYQYSQFCDLYASWRQKLAVSMRQVHRAGKKAFVDYSGKKPSIVDSRSGEVTEAELYVSLRGRWHLRSPRLDVDQAPVNPLLAPFLQLCRSTTRRMVPSKIPPSRRPFVRAGIVAAAPPPGGSPTRSRTRRAPLGVRDPQHRPA
jgi:hypothetical protein